MKSNFNGERLKLARIYRNYTISDFAKMIDVTKQAILQYEKNEIRPKPDTEFRITTALRFPREFFYQEDLKCVSTDNTFFRALSTAKKIDLQTQEVKTEFIVIIYNFLKQYFNYPDLNVPKLDLSEYETIEDIAMAVRNYWNLGEEPVINMVNLLEKNGIIVSTLNIDNKKIDAFTQEHTIDGKEEYCVILSNDKQSNARRNFDAAHELGHIILHSKIEKLEDLTDEERKDLEEEANNFAAAFLLPKNAFFKDLESPTSLESYKELKRKWRVSIAAMIMRASQLKRLNNSQFLDLIKLMSYKKWRKNEPLDNEWKLQEVVIFKKSIDMLKSYNVLTGNQILYKLANMGLPMYAEELEELLDLEKGTLIDKKQNSDEVVINFNQ